MCRRRAKKSPPGVPNASPVGKNFGKTQNRRRQAERRWEYAISKAANKSRTFPHENVKIGVTGAVTPIFLSCCKGFPKTSF